MAIGFSILIPYMIFTISARTRDEKQRSQSLQVIYYMENFEYVDEISIIKNHETLINVNYANPNFEKIMTLLYPFRTGRGERTSDDMQSLVDGFYSHNLSIEYFIEGEMLFTVDIFEFLSMLDINTEDNSNIFEFNVFLVGELYAIAINKPTNFLFSFDFPYNSLDLLLIEQLSNLP